MKCREDVRKPPCTGVGGGIGGARDGRHAALGRAHAQRALLFGHRLERGDVMEFIGGARVSHDADELRKIEEGPGGEPERLKSG